MKDAVNDKYFLVSLMLHTQVLPVNLLDKVSSNSDKGRLGNE
jgi:hypothetical protein